MCNNFIITITRYFVWSARECLVWRHKNTSKKKDLNEKWKKNQPLNIKSYRAANLNLGLSNFRWSFYFILFLVASLLFRRIFYDVTQDTFQCFAKSVKNGQDWSKCYLLRTDKPNLNVASLLEMLGACSGFYKLASIKQQK